MVREREKFWEYVEDSNGRLTCKFCKHKISGGITRIKSHLSRVRGRDIEICSDVPEDVRLAALQAIMDKKRERIWDYVEYLNGQLLCKFCKQSFPTDMTKIKSHFSGVRGPDIEICQKVPEAVRSSALEAMGAPNKKAKSSTSTSTSLNDIVGEAETISTSAPNKEAKNLHQPVVFNKDKSTAVEKLLAKFLISNTLPLDVSKTPFLADLLKNIAEFSPTCELPNYLAFKSQLIPDVQKEVEEYIGNVKRSLKKTGCTLLIHKVKGYFELVRINFFAYSPAGLVYIDKITVPGEGLTFQHFTDSIYRIIKSLGPENVVQCIIDDDGYEMVESFIDFEDDDLYSSVKKMINSKYPWIYLSQCATSQVDILLKPIYYFPLFYTTSNMANLIFNYLCKHDIDLIPRRNHTRNWQFNHSGFIEEIAIRFYVLHSILEIETELKALQLPRDENFVAEADDLHKAIHSTEFWSNGKTVVQVLQPSFQVLELIDCYGSTSGYIYHAMKKAHEAFKQHEAFKHHFERFKPHPNCITNPMYAAAAFLNPAYMCSQNFTEGDEIQMGLELLTALVPTDEQVALLEQMQLYRIKVSELFTATAVEMLNKFHPRKWWECFGDHYPILQKYAIRILSQTCSTSLCRPCNFQPDNLVYEFSMNMIMMENFRLLKSQSDLEPIAVDRISGLPEFANEYVFRKIEICYSSDDDDDYYLDILDSRKCIITSLES